MGRKCLSGRLLQFISEKKNNQINNNTQKNGIFAGNSSLG